MTLIKASYVLGLLYFNIQLKMLNSKLYKEDLIEASQLFNFNFLNDKVFFITGANGGLGKSIIDLLDIISVSYKINITVISAVRRLSSEVENRNIRIIRYLYDFLSNIECPKCDYIIHCASISDPLEYINSPEEIIRNLIGMEKIIKYSIQSSAKLIYISSGEVYGNIKNDKQNFVESDISLVQSLNSRSAYQINKISCENLIVLSSQTKFLDYNIVRLCHLFGPTYKPTDKHVSQLCINNALMKEDIVLKSDGSMIRSHCYIVDAALSVLFILIKDLKKSVFNISDPAYNISVKEFAEICSQYSNTKLTLASTSYSFRNRAILNSEKLMHLGFRPITSNGENKIVRTIQILKEHNFNNPNIKQII